MTIDRTIEIDPSRLGKMKGDALFRVGTGNGFRSSESDIWPLLDDDSPGPLTDEDSDGSDFLQPKRQRA